MAKSFFRILTLFLIIGKLPTSNGFFWPFTLWKSSSSNSSPDLLLRPYLDDLTPLPPNSDHLVINELVASSPPNLDTFNENHVSNQLSESLDQTNITSQNVHQIRWFGRPFGTGNHQHHIGLKNGHFYSENFVHPKRFNHINRFRHYTNNNLITNEPNNFKYIYPNENQYLIIQTPKIQQQQQNVRGEMFEENNYNIPRQSNVANQQIFSPFTGNNWVYLSPVDKLNSQHQPLILEAYVDPNNNNNNNNNQIQSFTSKNVKSKQMTPQRTIGTIKFPLLSWFPSTTYLQFPFLFKTKQHPQIQENQNHQQQYHQISNSFITSPNVNQRPIYVYNPGSSINNGGSTDANYYNQSPNRIQFPKSTISEYQSIRTQSNHGIPSSPTTQVSQIEANQDLVGWDSAPLPDIIKPGTNTMTETSGNSKDINEPNAQTILSSELVGEANSTTVPLIQQPSHRIIYQALSPLIATNAVNSTMTTVNGRSLYNHTLNVRTLNPSRGDFLRR